MKPTRPSVAVLLSTLIAVGLAASCAAPAQTATGAAQGGADQPAPASVVDPTTVPAAVASRPPSPSPGCAAPSGAPVPPGVTTPVPFSSGGRDRVYRRFVPGDLDRTRPVPLVLDLHGLAEPMDVQAQVSDWEGLAARDGFVVLTPQGLGPIVNWNASTAGAGTYDIAFLRELIDATGVDLCIDTSRVYVGGLSNGGLMSSAVACKLGDKVAAVGLVAGITRQPDCQPTRPVPAIVFWGKKDVVLPYYGGLGPGLQGFTNPRGPRVPVTPPTAPVADNGGLPPVEDVVATWARDNGCQPQPAVDAVGEHVERRTYTTCADGATVQLFAIADGSHSWPGSTALQGEPREANLEAVQGRTTTEIAATPTMWEFYRRFQLPA